MDKLFIQLNRKQLMALRAKGMSRAAVFVYLELQFYMIGDKIECWPSQQKIADNLDMTPRTVRNAIAQLKEAGLLIVDADKRVTNTYKNGSVEIEEQEEKVILFEAARGKSDPVDEEKVILSIGKSDPVDEEKVILLNREKKEKKEIEKKKESMIDHLVDTFDYDKRDLWIESLMSEHAASLGWTTTDLNADIKAIKRDCSILTVERACKSLDIFIRDRNKQNLFRGRGWVQGLINWIDREPSGKLSESQSKKYSRSVLSIDAEQAEKDKHNAIEEAVAAQNTAMINHEGARGLWGYLWQQFEGDYQEIDRAVGEMVDHGKIPDDVRKEIAKDPDLEVFDALISGHEYRKTCTHGGW